MLFDTKQLEKFPVEPGVYLMKDKHGKVIYVGKANILRQRVKQYFAPGGDGRPQIPYLTALVQSIDTIVVASEKEALLLENTLIKKYQPKYNVLLKDDKGYLSLKITHKQAWPMIKMVRYKGTPKDDALYFGPYTSALAAKQTLDLLNRLFRLRRCSDRELASRTRPCLLYQIKKCVAPCVNLCSSELYHEHVNRVIKFLKGQTQDVVEALKIDMRIASDKLEYEQAGDILKTIRAIDKTVEAQSVDQAGTGDSDALSLYRQGEDLVIAQMLIRGGRLLAVERFFFSKIIQDDSEIFESFIMQHYSEKQENPSYIYVPLDLSNDLSEIINARVCTPKRGKKKDLIDMAYKNAKAIFHKEKDESSLREKRLLELVDKLKLSQFPSRIECFDTSNISGAHSVASMVAFTDGLPDKKRYRKFHLEEDIKGPDDYAAMEEVLTRRYRRAKNENDLPELVIVDGGKGQLNIALRVLDELDITTIDVIGLAKEEGRHDKGITAEQVFLPNRKDPVLLNKHSSLLFFLQKIRDEAHRVAIDFHRKKRSKNMIKSALDDIPGIGPKKKKALIKAFGSVKGILAASDEDLQKVSELNKNDRQTIRAFIKHK